jgi:hypothetical protein
MNTVDAQKINGESSKYVPESNLRKHSVYSLIQVDSNTRESEGETEIYCRMLYSITWAAASPNVDRSKRCLGLTIFKFIMIALDAVQVNSTLFSRLLKFSGAS